MRRLTVSIPEPLTSHREVVIGTKAGQMQRQEPVGCRQWRSGPKRQRHIRWSSRHVEWLWVERCH